MIVKFTRNGRGRGSGPIDYLLGRDRNREFARVLQGNVEQVKELIDLSPYQKKYTSGFLSFAEPNLEEETKNQLMAEFESALLPGLEKDQYSILWVEHLDKGRLELNFLVPNIELQSGKRLQPYFHRADNPRIDAWRTIKNIELGLHDPDDPENRQLLSWKHSIPKDAATAREQITQILSAQIVKGNISNRDDVVNWLQSNGIEIARATKSSLSIKNPNPDAKRNIRLTGAMYEQTFQASRGVREELSRAIEEYRGSTDERLSEARERYQRCFARKREFNLSRYQHANFIPVSSPQGAVKGDEEDKRQYPIKRARRVRRKSLEDKRKHFAQSRSRPKSQVQHASPEDMDTSASSSDVHNAYSGRDELALHESDHGDQSELSRGSSEISDSRREELPRSLRRIYAHSRGKKQRESRSLDAVSEEVINDRVRNTPFSGLGTLAKRTLRTVRTLTGSLQHFTRSFERIREAKQRAIEALRAVGRGTEANEKRVPDCSRELIELEQAYSKLNAATERKIGQERPPSFRM